MQMTLCGLVLKFDINGQERTIQCPWWEGDLYLRRRRGTCINQLKGVHRVVRCR